MLKLIKRDTITNCPIFDLSSIFDDEVDIKMENQEIKTDVSLIIYSDNNEESQIIDFIGERQFHEKIRGKHFQQMSKEERLYLMKIKDSLLRKKNIHFAKHALDRMEERYIKERDIIKAIRNGQIIEYRENNYDRVVAIRGCTLNRRNENVYVIMSINNGKIITTYSNKHWMAYTKHYDLTKYVDNFSIKIPDCYRKQIQFYH